MTERNFPGNHKTAVLARCQWYSVGGLIPHAALVSASSQHVRLPILLQCCSQVAVICSCFATSQSAMAAAAAAASTPAAAHLLQLLQVVEHLQCAAHFGLAQGLHAVYQECLDEQQQWQHTTTVVGRTMPRMKTRSRCPVSLPPLYYLLLSPNPPSSPSLSHCRSPSLFLLSPIPSRSM